MRCATVTILLVFVVSVTSVPPRVTRILRHRQHDKPFPDPQSAFLINLLKHKFPHDKIQKIPTTPSSNGCICVPYYLCVNNTIVTDGYGTIDVRNRRCTGDFEVCCFLRVTPTPGQIVNPTPTPTPPTQPPTVPPTNATQPPTQPPTVPPTNVTQPPTPTTTKTPTAAPIQSCVCVPVYQCGTNGVIPGQTVISPRQQLGFCGGINIICCGVGPGSMQFPPYELPNNPPVVVTPPPTPAPTPAPTTLAPPPVVVQQYCVCVIIAQCGYGYIPGGSAIDPRLQSGRQLQIGSSCASSGEICCRVSVGSPGTAVGFPVNVPTYVNPSIILKYPGTPNACRCVSPLVCGDGCAVTFDGLGVIDPRFGACASAELVCCRIVGCGQIIVPPVATLPPVVTAPPVTSPPVIPNAQCGIRGTAYASSTAVEAGKTYFAEYPWMVLIILRRPGYVDVLQCGGSMISSRAVLTAAHCVIGCAPGTLVARFGEWDTQNNNEALPYTEVVVQNIITHPQYYSAGLYHDVAVLILTQAVPYAVNIAPVCLPLQGQTFAAGTTCYATGWGRSSFGADGQYQSILRKVDLPIVDNNNCQSLLRNTKLGTSFELHPSFVCAGGVANKDTCYKDGGGPLVCADGSGKYYQVGIVSWGIGCGTSTPAVYASVPQHAQWINQQLAAYGATT